MGNRKKRQRMFCICVCRCQLGVHALGLNDIQRRGRERLQMTALIISFSLCAVALFRGAASRGSWAIPRSVFSAECFPTVNGQVDCENKLIMAHRWLYCWENCWRAGKAFGSRWPTAISLSALDASNYCDCSRTHCVQIESDKPGIWLCCPDYIYRIVVKGQNGHKKRHLNFAKTLVLFK